MGGTAVTGEKRVMKWAEDAALGDTRVQDNGGGGVVAHGPLGFVC